MDNWREWRKQQRAYLIARRKQITVAERSVWSEAITTSLTQGFPVLQQRCVGFYSPYQGEYDPAPVMAYLSARGATLALPEVIGPHQPLKFRKWWPQAPMRKDAYGIAMPHDTEQVVIHAAVIPMIGFDNQGYRLGYGSGFFDRTLAAIHPRPLTIGIAFELLHLPTIYPHEHDIAMDYIVTEKTVYCLADHVLQPISREMCAMENALE
ncbi:5-formyltetrahydrofolate cyclo-ligase [Nitrosomonas sp. Nm58]|uniref:5-formyltetrahydrofolate cyclo-ligase n=1 Tax=Nitrosomonas sp. Nm58 TaxID=200126 RepID=UPI00089A081A|nr:5-formyltetrahydrofolate cyclo-ligase [Nitrosomonas sp. Nm58]SDY06947.1 5,10-methenyltetrahydrofolate synthetase [Nitrosomonas sp. Nm58]